MRMVWSSMDYLLDRARMYGLEIGEGRLCCCDGYVSLCLGLHKMKWNATTEPYLEIMNMTECKLRAWIRQEKLRLWNKAENEGNTERNLDFQKCDYNTITETSLDNEETPIGEQCEPDLGIDLTGYHQPYCLQRTLLSQ